MRPEEFAAYLGAAAWLPQVWLAVRRYWTKPVVRVVPDSFADIVVNAQGPLLGMRLVFDVTHKDLLVEDMELRLQHDDGDIHVLNWSLVGETLSHITDAAGNKQTFAREVTPIALKVGPQVLAERMVRFHESQYKGKEDQLFGPLREHFEHLKATKTQTYASEVIASKEMAALLEWRRQYCWWKAGRYTAALSLKSREPFKMVPSGFQFELSQRDIVSIKQNLKSVQVWLENDIWAGTPGYVPERDNGTYVTVPVGRT